MDALPTSHLARAANALRVRAAENFRLAELDPPVTEAWREHYMAEYRRDLAAAQDFARIVAEREADDRDAIRHGCYGRG